MAELPEDVMPSAACSIVAVPQADIHRLLVVGMHWGWLRSADALLHMQPACPSECEVGTCSECEHAVNAKADSSAWLPRGYVWPFGHLIRRGVYTCGLLSWWLHKDNIGVFSWPLQSKYEIDSQVAAVSHSFSQL